VCLTARAKPSSPPVPAVAHRWACCAAPPNILKNFIHAKDKGDLKNFNYLVGVTDEFMQRYKRYDFALIPRGRAGMPQKEDGAFQKRPASGFTATSRPNPVDQIMRSTYDHAEPGGCFWTRSTVQQPVLL